jgi:hypothetical protein
MNNLAVVLHSEGNYVEAEKLKRQTLDIRRRIPALSIPIRFCP